MSTLDEKLEAPGPRSGTLARRKRETFLSGSGYSVEVMETRAAQLRGRRVGGAADVPVLLRYRTHAGDPGTVWRALDGMEGWWELVPETGAHGDDVGHGESRSGPAGGST